MFHISLLAFEYLLESTKVFISGRGGESVVNTFFAMTSSFSFEEKLNFEP